MSFYRVRINHPVDPAELAMLQRVLDHICANRQIAKASGEAEETAALLVELFSHGVRQEHHLSTLAG